jgi:wyosine [tRNA(Phe)-imidazoG37] synthetase (radical SAM superfamily)
MRPQGRPARPVALAFGPVPSRRLGHSLGINNIPPKVCSYSCVYCQVGSTPSPRIDPLPVYPTAEIVAAVTAQLAVVRARGERVDHLTFVPDGEPTLDASLRSTIVALRPLGVPIAVITNGSLAWRPEVRAALREADWVSVKVDAVDEPTWRAVDRPHPQLHLPTVLDGIRELARCFPGRLVSETMLVAGVNDSEACADRIATFLGELAIDTAYLAVPTRPPADPRACGPDTATVTRIYGRFAAQLDHVELLTGYEGDAFAATGDARADLLAITAVHPMRASAVDELLTRNDADREVLERLVADRLLVPVDHGGDRYYTRPVVGPRAPHERGITDPANDRRWLRRLDTDEKEARHA